jgi:hypothetical protein
MKRLSTALGLLGICLTLASAQARPANNAPVTEAEVALSVARMEQAIQSVLRITAMPKRPIRASNQVATREHIVREFDRLFELARPHFKFTPNQVRFDATMLNIGAAERPALEKLIGWGAVAKVGPLATSPTPGLTPREYGDALGFMLLRIADLTHTPSSRWSPYLMGTEPGFMQGKDKSNKDDSSS